MINELEIHNFKSIKDLTLPCKRFNIFIGEPNTGKSNILEALGLLSFVGVRQSDPEAELSGFVRHERISDLFFDQEVERAVQVKWGCQVLYIRHHDGFYEGICEVTIPIDSDDPMDEPERIVDFTASGNTILTMTHYLTVFDEYEGLLTRPTKVRFYRRPSTSHFRESDSEHLIPPFGHNLISLLVMNRDLREIVGLPLSSLGYKLWLRPHENQIDVAKDSEDMVVTSFPYSLASETLQRITFYTAAIETNKNAVIVLEEPEAHSFPGETKLLAEQIAMDENDNQYFIVTHNPYFLMPLLSKAPKDDRAINIVYSEEYQTKVRVLTPDELPELFELDIFANLERYLEP